MLTKIITNLNAFESFFKKIRKKINLIYLNFFSFLLCNFSYYLNNGSGNGGDGDDGGGL